MAGSTSSLTPEQAEAEAAVDAGAGWPTSGEIRACYELLARSMPMAVESVRGSRCKGTMAGIDILVTHGPATCQHKGALPSPWPRLICS